MQKLIERVSIVKLASVLLAFCQRFMAPVYIRVCELNKEEKKPKTVGGLCQTMDREGTAVWLVRSASGGTPKPGASVFQNVRWLSPKLLVELLAKVGHMTNKQHTLYRVPLEPDMKLALTLRHISSGRKYASMKFGERVPHNT